MYIPAFIMEESDIKTLKDRDAFLGEYIEKYTGMKYFKINSRKFDEILDYINSSDTLSHENKQDVEFDFRIVVSIFTTLMDGKTHSLDIINAILAYNAINKGYSQVLMSLVR